MKHFFRTAIGKTVLFIICVVSVISLALSALGIAGLMSQAREFYLQSEEGFLEMLYTDRLRSDGYSAIWQMRKTSDKELLPDCGNAVFIIRDQLGTVLARSAGSSGITNWKYSMAYMVFRADDGGFDIEYIGEANGAGPVTGEEGTEIYTVSFAFKSGFPEMDMYAAINRFAPVIYKLRYWIFAIAAVSLLAAILSFGGTYGAHGVHLRQSGRQYRQRYRGMHHRGDRPLHAAGIVHDLLSQGETGHFPQEQHHNEGDDAAERVPGIHVGTCKKGVRILQSGIQEHPGRMEDGSGILRIHVP